VVLIKNEGNSQRSSGEQAPQVSGTAATLSICAGFRMRTVFVKAVQASWDKAAGQASWFLEVRSRNSENLELIGRGWISAAVILHYPKFGARRLDLSEGGPLIHSRAPFDRSREQFLRGEFDIIGILPVATGYVMIQPSLLSGTRPIDESDLAQLGALAPLPGSGSAAEAHGIDMNARPAT
jgi:hypothetical protein